MREGGGHAPLIFYWPLKLIRTALLLIAFIAFAGGLYDNVSWAIHKLVGTPLEGVVTDLEPTDIGFAKPTVDYVLPLDGSEWRVESRLPRDDLTIGDKVAVSVIPGSEGLTRIERSSFWRMVSIAALIGGALGIWAIRSIWPGVETALGWKRHKEPATSSNLGFVAATLIVAVLGATAWMKFIHMPWLGVAEYGALVNAPDEVMRKAALRCGPAAPNPLNACEMRVLGLAPNASEGAYLAALNENDFESLARYHAAIANPEIPFSIDWSASAPLLLERDPAILLSLLSTGATPPPEVAFDLIAVSETRGWTDVSAALRRMSQPEG